MNAMKSAAIIILINVIRHISSECILSIRKDLSSPAPVYLRSGEYLAPGDGGAISLRTSEAVQVACPGDGNSIVLADNITNYETLDAYCVTDTTFRVGEWVGDFGDILCDAHPLHMAEETPEACHETARIYKVGYRVQGTLHALYEACFDRNSLHTLYVRHSISPVTLYRQPHFKRPKFIEGDLFGAVNMSTMYSVYHQRSRVDELVGQDMSQRYITGKQKLTRGHMAACADFSLFAESRATFHYINTAPQWSLGNAGDWSALEEALRQRVNELGYPVSVVTGAHGVMSLTDAAGTPHDLYLAADDNNNGLLPVPLYYYKLVYDPVRATATAFVSINSSYYNSSAVQALSFCADQCSRAAWLRWRNDDTHSFCCDYQQFLDTVHYLPPINVTGLFY